MGDYHHHHHRRDCHKDYMDEQWFLFLPLYIFIAVAIIALIALLFSGAGAAAFIGLLIFLVLWALLIWWLCDICELGWAWFALLLPVIVSLLTGIVGAGVALGLYGSKEMYRSEMIIVE